MNPTITIFYDGIPKDLDNFFYKSNYSLVPGYEKDGKKYWTTTGTIRGTNILVSKPLELALLKKKCESWLKQKISNLTFLEITELTRSTELGQDARKIIEDIVGELFIQDRSHIIIDSGLEKILVAVVEGQITQILNNARIYIALNANNL